MPVGLGLGRDHEPHYGRREGMVLMPYDPLWVGQLAGLRGRTVEPAAGPRGTRCHRQYSFRRQPEVAQRDKDVTTQTCFLPRGRRAQARSVGEGASPCQANLGVFHGRLLRRGVRAKGAGPSGRNKPAGFPLTFVCLFVCLIRCLEYLKFSVCQGSYKIGRFVCILFLSVVNDADKTADKSL